MGMSDISERAALAAVLTLLNHLRRRGVNAAGEEVIREIESILRELQAQVMRDKHVNPPLAVYALNPPMSHRVYAIEYKHAEDGKDYRHDFQTGVLMAPQSDGSLVIRHKANKPLVEDF